MAATTGARPGPWQRWRAAGIKGGAVVGKTNANGTAVVDRQVNGGHLFHTYLRANGAKPEEELVHRPAAHPDGRSQGQRHQGGAGMSFLAAGPPPPVKIDPAQTHLVSQWKHTAPLVGCRFDPSGQYVFAGAQDNALVRLPPGHGQEGGTEGAQVLGAGAGVRGEGEIAVLGGLGRAPDRLARRGQRPGLESAGSTRAGCAPGRQPRRQVPGVVRQRPARQTLAGRSPDGKTITATRGHQWHVYNVAFHPAGTHLASADLHGIVKVCGPGQGSRWRRDGRQGAPHKYDTNFGARPRRKGAEHGVQRRWQPGGLCAGITNVSNAFAGIGNPLVVLFDFETGKQKQLLRPKVNFNGTAWGVAFHPQGFILGVGGGNGGVLWAWKPETPLAFYADLAQQRPRPGPAP